MNVRGLRNALLSYDPEDSILDEDGDEVEFKFENTGPGQVIFTVTLTDGEDEDDPEA